jgi:hypothetical protein
MVFVSPGRVSRFQGLGDCYCYGQCWVSDATLERRDALRCSAYGWLKLLGSPFPD